MINERTYWAIVFSSLALGFMYAAAKDLWKGLTGQAEAKLPEAEAAMAYARLDELRAGTHLP